MARYVLDANIIVGWLLSRPAPADFIGQLTTGDEVYAAQLLLPECTSAIRSEVFDRRVDNEEAQQLVSKLLRLPLKLVESSRQFVRALDLAQRFDHRNAYDMQYLAVAELVNAELITMDRGLRHAAEQIGVPVRFVS